MANKDRGAKNVKKSGKSLKEKRAVKKAKAAGRGQRSENTLLLPPPS